ncbi:MAG: hypothetical protein HYU78_03690 [Rhodocyclales bacterium]|nr:hypothetical protein [Rhodocyclales bacterium]
MLAPLKDRSVLADEAPEAREIRDLRRALRASRLRLRRSALHSTRQIMALNAEVSRLQALSDGQARQIERYASGTVIVDLGRKLSALAEANDRLRDAARRATMLERALGIADAECRRLSAERDALARELFRSRHDGRCDSPTPGDTHGRLSV